MWKNRAGQSREETKVSDRFTSKDLSSCSSEPEGGEEGKTRLADNRLDILFLTFSLQSPKWFKFCLCRRLLLPLMSLQQSQALHLCYQAPAEQKDDDICMFSESRISFAAALGCASALRPRGPRDMPQQLPFSSAFCCMGDL